MYNCSNSCTHSYSDDISIFQLESLTTPVNPEAYVPVDAVHAKPARKGAGPRKRRQSTPAIDTPLDKHQDDDESLATARKKFRSERSTRGRRDTGGVGGSGPMLPPQVLQPMLQEIFEEFWNLELSPPQVAIPFFSHITRDNCDLLGLPGFYERVMQECTLANINVGDWYVWVWLDMFHCIIYLPIYTLDMCIIVILIGTTESRVIHNPWSLWIWLSDHVYERNDLLRTRDTSICTSQGNVKSVYSEMDRGKRKNEVSRRMIRCVLLVWFFAGVWDCDDGLLCVCVQSSGWRAVLYCEEWHAVYSWYDIAPTEIGNTKLIYTILLSYEIPIIVNLPTCDEKLRPLSSIITLHSTIRCPHNQFELLYTHN